MTQEVYLSIIVAIVFLATYLIYRLYRDNEQLRIELKYTQKEAKILESNLHEQRESEGVANAYIKQLKTQLDVMGKRLAEYNNEAKGYKIRFNAVAGEYEKIREQIKILEAKINEWEHAYKASKIMHKRKLQSLYGRIGAMQRRINRLKGN